MKKISIGILTYNHENYIEKCLRSVLSSNYPNLEILISDDASNDKTTEVIEKVLSNIQTFHTILFQENEKNLGLADNFNKTFRELATGDFLVTLGGDDMIKEDYFEMAIAYFEKNPKLMMLDFNADIIDENDKVTKSATSLGYEIKFKELENYLSLEPIESFAPGRMIRKELVQNFEPISKSCPTEDSVLVLRALIMGKFGRLNKDVIYYRRHSRNISSAENLAKLSNASIIAQYFKDVVYTYNHNQLSEILIVRLLDRINFEFHKRENSYKAGQSFIQRLMLRLRKYMYLNSIKKIKLEI